MQYHLNGYTCGDPAVAVEHRQAVGKQPVLPLPSQVDVLIVGCGPAGLTLAAQLANFHGIHVAIVDQKTEPLQVGQADGIACRTMEMFQAFGFADRVVKEAYWVNETVFWKPAPENPVSIARHGRVQDTEDGLSEFPHVILNQARVHDFFLDLMSKSVGQISPYYARSFKHLEMLENTSTESDSYPITAYFEDASEGKTSQEAVRAKYVVGCDGARSAVRESIGLQLKGDSANKAWGVMDVLAITDFPDIRFKCLIQSAAGSIVLIPREGGHMVRLYVELDDLEANQRVSGKQISIEQLIAKAQKIFIPYQIDVKDIAWWSVYQIGQRLCDKFDDVPYGELKQSPRVFIAGDACHTHSPKAGQGMNVSMRDSFNLGWKLASVLQGKCSPNLLHTYSNERQSVARELIEFDQQWTKIVSSANKRKDKIGTETSAESEEFQRYFVKHARYTAGTSIQYKPSMISAEGEYQRLATGFAIGTRFHSAPVVRVADAKPMHLGHVVLADGRWRIFLFADEAHPSDKASTLSKLCDYFLTDKNSLVNRYTPSSADIDSVFDIRAVYQQDIHAINICDVPKILLPHKGRYGLRDYEKCFCIDRKLNNDIYTMRGIDKRHGCIVVVRPDQHIATVLPLDAHSQLLQFFAPFMLPITT